MLSEDQCLSLLEQGAARHPLDRALLLAAQAGHAEPWADVPLGVRDAQLAALRTVWFGPELQVMLRCPACGEMLSAAIDLRALPAAPAANEVRLQGRAWRLPTTRDLAAVVASPDDAADDEEDNEAIRDRAARRLLSRLAIDAQADARPSDAAPDLQAIESALDAADPLAHLEIEFGCERCGHRHARPLDIAACLWDDVAARAEQLLGEVHALACAYGWTQGEILGLSAARRQLYLERLQRVGA